MTRKENKCSIKYSAWFITNSAKQHVKRENQGQTGFVINKLCLPLNKNIICRLGTRTFVIKVKIVNPTRRSIHPTYSAVLHPSKTSLLAPQSVAYRRGAYSYSYSYSYSTAPKLLCCTPLAPCIVCIVCIAYHSATFSKPVCWYSVGTVLYTLRLYSVT